MGPAKAAKLSVLAALPPGTTARAKLTTIDESEPHETMQAPVVVVE